MIRNADLCSTLEQVTETSWQLDTSERFILLHMHETSAFARGCCLPVAINETDHAALNWAQTTITEALARDGLTITFTTEGALIPLTQK